MKEETQRGEGPVNQDMQEDMGAPASVPSAGIGAVLAEVERATAKFPTWPTDPLHALAVLGEEFGELTKAVLQSVYEPHKVGPDDVREEAIQTAAMALRFLMSLGRYELITSDQHLQDSPAIAQPRRRVPSEGRERDGEAGSPNL
jgi:hypothetical protein